MRKGLRSTWSQANQLGNEDQTDKAANHHNWVASPLRMVTVNGPPFSVPRDQHLDLGRQVDYPPSQPVGSGFEPHWRSQPAKLPSFGGYSLETLPYLLGRQTQRNVARFRSHSHTLRVETRSWEYHDGTCDNNQTGAFYFSQACSEDVFNFFQRQTIVYLIAYGCFPDGWCSPAT